MAEDMGHDVWDIEDCFRYGELYTDNYDVVCTYCDEIELEWELHEGRWFLYKDGKRHICKTGNRLFDAANEE